MAISFEAKMCKGCGQTKPTTCFAIDNNATNGRQQKCRDCRHVYYLTNKVAYSERNKERRESNPEAVRVYAAQYHVDNIERIHAYHAKRDRDNPHLKQQAQHKRRALMYANGPVDVIHIQDLFWRDEGMCGICLMPTNLSIKDGNQQATTDHIIPLSRGGTHTWGNVQLAHSGCNKRKWAKLPEGVTREVRAWL